jgi:hypothetical protein
MLCPPERKPRAPHAGSSHVTTPHVRDESWSAQTPTSPDSRGLQITKNWIFIPHYRPLARTLDAHSTNVITLTTIIRQCSPSPSIHHRPIARKSQGDAERKQLDDAAANSALRVAAIPASLNSSAEASLALLGQVDKTDDSLTRRCLLTAGARLPLIKTLVNDAWAQGTRSRSCRRGVR